MDLQKVLELINKADAEQHEKLDLSEMGLTELPLEIANLHNLKLLNLCHNQLTTIPEAVLQLANLEQL